MGKTCFIIFVVILALLISDGDCWGRRRRRRRRSGGRWSLSNGGVTYKFKNGHSVTGYGSFKNGGSIGLKYTIPIGRKRRSVEDEKLGGFETYDSGMPMPFNPKPLFFKNQKQVENDKIKASDDLSPPENGMIQERDDCSQCLEIQPFNTSDQNVENTTLASNDFVMVVKLIEENLSALKLDAKIKFEVIEVIKSSTDNVTSGQTFTIKAQMATCPCLATLDPGFYVVTGQTNDENQLVLSNVLMEFEN